MLGLDGAGKKTILYKLKFGDHILPIIHVGNIEYNGIQMDIWDVSGSVKFRPLWRHYYPISRFLIFVVDSNDTERIPEARDELHKFLEKDDFLDAALLIYANKQDLPNAIKSSELEERLQLSDITNRPWKIQKTCAITGDGLYEGLDWLIMHM